MSARRPVRTADLLVTLGLSATLLGTPPGAPAQDLFPLPPVQPATGPAGSDYPFPGEPFREGVDGLGGYTVYEPNPRPESAPVVLFLRGACTGGQCSMTRSNGIMVAWRDHLVKKGNIVIFPHFQEADEPALEEERIADATRQALSLLEESGHVLPEHDNFGILGHSRGSQMTVNVASRFDAHGIPEPRWLLVVEPGPTSQIGYDSLANIPAETKLVVVTGEEDTLAGETKARLVWEATAHIDDANRDYVLVRSDRRGLWALLPQPVETPLCTFAEAQGGLAGIAACATWNLPWLFLPRFSPSPTRSIRNTTSELGDLTADHYFPGMGTPLDIHALWKISQALIDCTRAGESCETALGGGPAQRFMGQWSDGQPVRELCVTDEPPEDWSEACDP